MYPPHAKLTRMVDASVEPLSLTDAKNYLRVEIDDDDDLISDMITAARLECERINDRSFITTTWKWTLDYLPFGGGFWGHSNAYGAYPNRITPHDGGLTLPMPPLITLTSLTYIDQGGMTQSVDVSDQSAILVDPGTPGRIYPAYAQIFPITQQRPFAVNFIYTAGYGPDASDIPKNIIMAMRLLVSHYYEHRTINAEVPDAVVNLLSSTAWGNYA